MTRNATLRYMSTGTAQTRSGACRAARVNAPATASNPKIQKQTIPAFAHADGPVRVPRPVEAAELEHPPRRPEDDLAEVDRVVADVVERRRPQLALQLRLRDRADPAVGGLAGREILNV